MNKLDALLSKLKGVVKIRDGEWLALCPAHNDTNPSLSVKLVSGKILLHCQAGCSIDAVMKALDITWEDLFLDEARPKTSSRTYGDIDCVYPYHDTDGKLLFEVVRYRNPKGFSQRQPDPSQPEGYRWGLRGITPVIYHLPEVLVAINSGDPVWVVEGEKDADNLTAAFGITATCNPMGSGKWREKYTDNLAGAKEVRIIPDNDPPGHKHAQYVARSLYQSGIPAKVIEPSDGCKDISDWLDAGLTRDELLNSFNNAPIWEPAEDKKIIPAGSWRDSIISHDDLMNTEITPIEFTVENLVPRPGITALAGKKKIGKSFFVLQMAQGIANGNGMLGLSCTAGRVVYMALEDGKRRLRQRLQMQRTEAGMPIIYVTEFKYLNTHEGKRDFIEMIEEYEPILVIIDTIKKAVNFKLDENDSGPTADFYYWMQSTSINYNLSILVVAHHGKAKITPEERDAGFDIRGTSAIPGATDCNIGIYKNSDGTFDLLSEARDYPEMNLRIELDREVTWSWQNLGDAKDARQAQAENDIIKAMDELGASDITAESMAELTGKTVSAINTALKKMRDAKNERIAWYVATGRKNKILYSLNKLLKA